VGLGSSITVKEGEIPTARFTIGDRAQVFDENDEPVAPGSGKQGLIAMAQPLPLGYYKDEAKTAKTFRTIRGKRYSIPGDFCTVEADGTITLLGRGNATINTAGEKVFPEEVEEVLKTHPSVEDALVVGVPDEKWGQAITAVIKTAPGYGLSEADLVAHVKDRLAAYKSPKRVLLADGISLRAPNGKADYKTASAFARQSLSL
jgi:fatty-acyl-CoA synthase